MAPKKFNDRKASKKLFSVWKINALGSKEFIKPQISLNYGKAQFKGKT